MFHQTVQSVSKKFLMLINLSAVLAMTCFALQANDLELFGKFIAEGANVENIGQHYWRSFFKEPCEQRQAFLDILNKSGYQLSGTDEYGRKVLGRQ